VPLTTGRLQDAYRQMLVIRKFEETIRDLYQKGKIRGSFHPCVGQEATAVGGCWALRNDDYMTCTYRGHGQAIAKGLSVRAAMAEMLGKVGIRATVQTPEAGVFRNKWFKSEMPLYMISYGNVAQDGTAFLYTYFRSGTDPRSKYRNPEVDRLFDEQEGEFDRARRTSLLRRTMQLLKEDAPALPLYNDQYTVGVRNRVVVPKGIPTAGEYMWLWKMDTA